MSKQDQSNERDGAPVRGAGTMSVGVFPERRARHDRRRRVFWSVAYGNLNPRRRIPPRRGLESRFHILDWHDSHLLFVAIAILLLCVADAVLTLGLLSSGAEEANPVMGLVVYGDSGVFAGVKMAMTGLCVICMVCLARYRFMRLIRVDLVLYGVMLAYTGLIGYEFRMLEVLRAGILH